MFLEYEFGAQAEYVIQPHITISPASQTCKSIQEFCRFIVNYLFLFLSSSWRKKMWIFVKEQKNPQLNPIRLFSITDVADV